MPVRRQDSSCRTMNSPYRLCNSASVFGSARADAQPLDRLADLISQLRLIGLEPLLEQQVAADIRHLPVAAAVGSTSRMREHSRIGSCPSRSSSR